MAAIAAVRGGRVPAAGVYRHPAGIASDILAQAGRVAKPLSRKAGARRGR